MTLAEDTAELSWRIPTDGEPQLYRIGLMQIAVATLFFSAIVLALAPAHMVWPALTAIAVVGSVLWWWNWRTRGSGKRRPDNVRIDLRGVAWLDESNGEHLFAREQIESFRIAHDAETLHTVPALHLSLAGGFESQPIELHAPAAPEDVRQLLITRLNLREQTPDEAKGRLAQSSLNGIGATVIEEEGVWEFQAPREELQEFCIRLAKISQRLADFPLGARPLELRLGDTVLLFSPRAGSPGEIDSAAYSGSAAELAALAERLSAALATAEVGALVEVPLADTPLAGQIRLRVASDARAGKSPTTFPRAETPP